MFLAACLLALLVLGGEAPAVGAPSGQPEGLARGPIAAAFLQAPLSFEVNRGQTAPQVTYLSRGPGYTLFLTAAEAVLVVERDQQTPRDARPPSPGTVLRMRLVGANPAPRVEGLEPLPGRSHYFIGNDPQRWRTDVPHYAKVRYEGIYPGIALIYYGSNQQLEYDFVVAPGADPEAIRLAFTGAEKLSLDANGNLLLHTPRGEILQHAPRVYQEVNGARQAVAGRYVLFGKDQVGFRVAAYDRTRPLVIDPTLSLSLSYSTFLGGSDEDFGLAIAVDSSGNAYVTGSTMSLNFPTQNAFQPALGGGTLGGGHDAFVTKLNPAGSALVYSTYFGGSTGDDQGTGIAVHSSGRVYVVGTTLSTDFPTLNAFQAAIGGDKDAFIAVFDQAGPPPTLALHYATYLGNSNTDEGLAIAVDSSGNAYVTGRTLSTSFPTKNAFQSTSGSPGSAFDAFVAKLDPSQVGAASLVYSTYLGGSGFDQGLGIAVDAAGNAYVTGSTRSTNFPTVNALPQDSLNRVNVGFLQDAFVAKITPPTLGGPASLVYSTFLGGSSQDFANGIAVDGSGNAYVTGLTSSSNFPTTATAFQALNNGSTDAFVAKLNPTLSGAASLVYSTYLGGIGSDQGQAVAVDTSGKAYVTGSSSPDFPTVNNVTGCGTGVNVGAGGDSFVAILDPTLSGSASLLYSTFLGGSNAELGAGIAVDGSGSNVYVAATTSSPNYPVTGGAFQTVFGGDKDAFVTKLAVVSTFCVTVNTAGSGTGTVTSSPSGIDCSSTGIPGTCSATFTSPTSVTLTAAPTGGSTFGGWSGGGCSGTGSCTVTGAATVTATFNPPPLLTVALLGGGTGTVTSSPSGITCSAGTCSAPFASGTSVTLTAAPTGGSSFAGWGGDCATAGTALMCTFTMNATKSVTATFNAPGSSPTLMVALLGSGTGTVTSSPSGITCSAGTCSATFTSGTSVTLTAAPTGSSTFSVWAGDCASAGTATTCTLTMDTSKSVTATFNAGGGGGGTGGGGDASCNMVGHVHGNQNYKATVSGKTANVHVEVDGDCDFDKKTGMIFLHHSMVHVVVDGGPPLIDAKQNINGKHSDVESVTLSMGPPATATVAGHYKGSPFEVTLTDGGKPNKNDIVVVVMPTLPAPITGSAPHNDVHIFFK